MSGIKKIFTVLAASLLVALGITLTSPNAQATVTGTTNVATITGSDFTWTCDVNPGGATIDVTGASWIHVDGSSFVETTKTRISGSTTQRLTYTRDGSENTNYDYRCKWYDTGGVLLGKSTVLNLTTTINTKFGVITGTLNDPCGTTAACWESIYNTHRTTFGARLGVRIFSSTTVPLATDTNVAGQFMTWIAANHPDEEITVSFKQYDATRLNTLMTWAQSHGIRLTIIYFHEPQDDCANGNTAACGTTYKSIYQQMRTTINAHPWHANVLLDKVLMWYWQQYNAASHPGTDWSNYVEPAVNGVKQDPADAVTWDAYQESWLTTYDPATTFMQYPLAVWNNAKINWGYGELGSHILSGDTTHDGWVNWISAMTSAARTPSTVGTSYANLPPAVSVKWWCLAGDAVGDPPFHLEQDSRAVANWAALTQAHPL